ncbi:hypothetical protein LCGC14_2520630 [marine sediment metagenome]|uniref:Uncharacterized protein n=1 Tax=marine sediment metagenome TaxID=412755 RepID=A0A0F9D821_9ZZZZ
MLKIEQIKYKRTGDQRLFYIAENNPQLSVNTIVYTAGEGRKELNFHNLEFEVWALDFVFKFPGKYIFIIFEDGLKTLILIITIG